MIRGCQPSFLPDMESAMEQEVPEGGEPKSAASIVAGILTKESPSSTFLRQVLPGQEIKSCLGFRV